MPPHSSAHAVSPSRRRSRRIARRSLAISVTTLGSLIPGSSRAGTSSHHPDAPRTRETQLATSEDAYVRELRTAHGVEWRFGTARAERRVSLESGHLALTNLTDRTTRHEYVQGPSDVLRFVWDKQVVTGRSAEWVLDTVRTRRLSQGELLLQLALHTTGVAVVKSYLLYPKESVVQEWLQITNRSRTSVVLDDPTSLEMHVLHKEAADVDLSSMSGDPNWRFSTAPLPTDSVRTFGGDVAPILVLRNRSTQDGLFMGWDYLGTWHSTVGNVGGTPVHLDFVTVYGEQLAPGDSVELPKVFTGTFHGDMDAMGHEMLNYQYRYKWDYTRDAYFPRTGVEGYWAAGSSYALGIGGTGGVFDPVSTYRKVFHVVDFMRAIGGELYWRDNGWWDNQGDWNGPDWGETRRYLARYGMGQILYIPIQDADAGSKVAKEHPEWIAGNGSAGPVLDQSRPAVIDWEIQLLESKWRQWGDFQWRKDWGFMGGSASRQFKQDQGYRRLLQTFLGRHQGAGYYGCVDVGYEMIRLSNTWGISSVPDVPAAQHWPSSIWAHQQTYDISYIFPPDKIEDAPDHYDPDYYEKGPWRGLLSNRVPFIGETEDPAKIEGVRLLVDINHYLRYKKVVGRWTWVYHPAVTGDSADWYIQRLSNDHRRGIIVLGHAAKHPITIYPKGLLPKETYNVSFQESTTTTDRSGADLMAHGIAFQSVPDGEVIYLNLPLHPGSAADRTPPAPPSHVTQQVATHMDYSGVELSWQPAHDNNWISYYEIERNGVPVGITATGTYYFDHALGADPAARYTVTAVDGSGNHSAPAAVASAGGPSALVLDDTNPALTYTGSGWEHKRGQWSVANGTQSVTNTPGDAVSVTFTGNRVTWYGRMGQHEGIAAVYLDGALDRLVDGYSADEIPNIALYSRVFPAVGRHTLKIVATGAQTGVAMKAHTDATQHLLVVDGVQVERAPVRLVNHTPGGGIAYQGRGWQHHGSVAGSSGIPAERGSASDRPGDRAEYTFTGRGITWVGRRCSTCGMANVYLDGQLVTSTDTYVTPTQADSLRSDEQHGVPLLTRRWAVPGRHTIRIVVRPDANLWAKGHTIYLDALQVTP